MFSGSPIEEWAEQETVTVAPPPQKNVCVWGAQMFTRYFQPFWVKKSCLHWGPDYAFIYLTTCSFKSIRGAWNKRKGRKTLNKLLVKKWQHQPTTVLCTRFREEKMKFFTSHHIKGILCWPQRFRQNIPWKTTLYLRLERWEVHSGQTCSRPRDRGVKLLPQEVKWASG